MIIQDNLNLEPRGIFLVERLQKLDELGAPMAWADHAQDFAAREIDPGQEAYRAMPDVFVVPWPGALACGGLEPVGWVSWCRAPECRTFHRMTIGRWAIRDQRRGVVSPESESGLVLILQCPCAIARQ